MNGNLPPATNEARGHRTWKRNNIHWLLVSDRDVGSQDFSDRAAQWGITLICHKGRVSFVSFGLRSCCRRYIVTSILYCGTGRHRIPPEQAATVSEVDVAAPATHARLLRGFFPAISDVLALDLRVFAFSLDVATRSRVYLG
ncbi:MAG: hypothetical protein IPP47_00375 [Bryobacterales bacterium]|nr:hypothetical protein [Bryobacterales bacterium]